MGKHINPGKYLLPSKVSPRWWWWCVISFPDPGYFAGDFPRPKVAGAVTCQRGRRGLALGRWDALRPAGVLEVAARAGRRGRGKGRARRASGGDGSAEGRCEAPARREPWREAAARRPHQCPGPQQRPRPPPWGPPGRRPRAPRAPDGRAPRARRPQRAAARGRAAREGALGCPSAPTNPASGTSDPEPGSLESAGGQRKEEEAPQPSPSRAPRCRPAGCCGGNRSRRAAGTRPRTTKRRRPGEPSARAAPRRRPPVSRLLRGRASCASRGFGEKHHPCIWRTRGFSRFSVSSSDVLIPREEPLLVCQTSWGPSARLPLTPAAGSPMAVGTSP
ncbi:uncharacterized protein [Sagmatias obliquidens]|uniref:uncharacterized protein n=1 Tax=Sagmatias obliquidens TaxID=3371155 RepID=UPI000F44286A|nr:uncharacterized protein LOC113615098 [Lagenorhynchus obliquidens]